MKCPGCGKDIDESRFPGGLAYCPYCGQELKVSQEGEQMLFCPYCGQKLSEPASFCPHCGKRLVLAEAKLARLKVIKDFMERTAKPIARLIKTARNPFSRKRKIGKLYQQWAEYASLPPEEIPPTDVPKEVPAEDKTKKDDSDTSESA